MIRFLLALLFGLGLAAGAEPMPGIVIAPGTTLTVPEDGPVLVIPFTLTDALAGDGSDRILTMFATLVTSTVPTVEVVGVDRAPLATSGTLRVRPLPNDFGSSVLVINLVTNDGLVGGLLVSVEVLPVNDAPVLAVNLAVATGMRGTVVYDNSHLLLSDVDLPVTDQLRYTVSALPAHGELRLNGTPLAAGAIFTQTQVAAGALSYRNLDGMADQWSFTFDDGAGQPAQGPAAAAIQVAGKALPVVSQLGSSSWRERDPPAFIAALALVEDGDSVNFLGGSLTVSITSYQKYGDELSIVSEGNGAGQIGVSGSALSYGGLAIGTWSGSGSLVAPLVVQFTTTTATPAATQALVRRIAFRNTTQDPDDYIRTVSMVVHDGDAGASPVATTRVTVIPVNDAPKVSIVSMSMPMGYAQDIMLRSEDPDSPSATWSVISPPAHGSVELKQHDTTYAIFRYTPTAGYVGLDSFYVWVSDGQDFSTGFATLTLCGPDDPILLPLADPPREAFPGDLITLSVPWDRGVVTSGSLSFALDSAAPSGASVGAFGSAEAFLSWQVPANQPTGVHVHFKLLANSINQTGAGVLPFSILIRPRPRIGG